MPTELKAGAHTFKVSNQGAQSHEMILFKLAEGKTLADMQAFLSNPESGGPPPGEQAGGAMPMAPGMRAWTTVESDARQLRGGMLCPGSAATANRTWNMGC